MNEKSNKNTEITGLILINALLFIISVPTTYPQVIQLTTGTLAFLLSTFLVFSFIKNRRIYLGILFAIVTVVYNPVFLYFLDFSNYKALDILIAFVLFCVALSQNDGTNSKNK